MNETHFTEKDRATLTTLEVKLDRAIQDIAALSANFALKSELADALKKIEKLESNQTWVTRTIIGIIIVALLGLVIISK